MRLNLRACGRRAIGRQHSTYVANSFQISFKTEIMTIAFNFIIRFWHSPKTFQNGNIFCEHHGNVCVVPAIVAMHGLCLWNRCAGTRTNSTINIWGEKKLKFKFRVFSAHISLSVRPTSGKTKKVIIFLEFRVVKWVWAGVKAKSVHQTFA